MGRGHTRKVDSRAGNIASSRRRTRYCRRRTLPRDPASRFRTWLAPPRANPSGRLKCPRCSSAYQPPLPRTHPALRPLRQRQVRRSHAAVGFLPRRRTEEDRSRGSWSTKSRCARAPSSLPASRSAPRMFLEYPRWPRWADCLTKSERGSGRPAWPTVMLRPASRYPKEDHVCPG